MKRLKTIISLITFICLTASGLMSQVTPKSFSHIKDTLDLHNTISDRVKTDSLLMPQSNSAIAESSGDEWYSRTPDSYQIYQSNIVGDIPYTFDVSSSGVSTVNVPLEGFSYPEGLSPQISLSYNCQSDIGPLGYGWGISGISTITRCGKTYCYDGETTGANSSQEFMLDGVRLIKLPNSEWYKSIQGNIKARKLMLVGSLGYFEVLYPDGKNAYYGKYDGNTYYLTSLMDLSGNEIVYNYEDRSGHYRIKNITYGDGAEIRFEYFNVLYGTSKFENGFETVYDYRLSMVKFFYKDNLKHTYIANFDQNKQLIDKIELYCAVAKINHLQFYYGPNKADSGEFTERESLLTSYLDFSDKNSIRISKGKFIHGSENDGLMMVSNKVTYYEKNVASIFEREKRHYYNYYDGREDIMIFSSLNHSITNSYSILKTEKGFIDIFSMDIDDAKGEEIVKVNNYIMGEGEVRGDWLDIHVYVNNPNYGLQKKYTRSYQLNNAINWSGTYSVIPKYYFTGDFNGDGKMELMIVSAAGVLGGRGPSSKITIIDLESDRILFNKTVFEYGITFPDEITSGDYAYTHSDRIYIMDYNGDGKSDICHIDLYRNTCISVYEFDKDFTSCNRIASTNIDLDTCITREIYPGDFNGDMKTDLIFTSKVNSDDQWLMLLSKGNGLFEQKTVKIEKRYGTSEYIIQDLNLDGRSDILTQRNTGGTNWEYRSYFINDGPVARISGGKASKEKYVLAPLSGSYPDYDNESLIIGPSGYVRFVGCNERNDKSRMLSGIIDSKGIITKIKYDRLLNGTFYELSNDASFPYYNYAGGLWVCSGIRRYNNGTLLNDISYKYTNAIGHKQGFGFCGFKQIDQTDDVTGKDIKNKFDPYRFGVLTYDLSQTQENSYTYSINHLPDKTMQILLTGKTSVDLINNNTVRTTSNYDSYGNVLSTVNLYDGGYKTEQHNVYLENSNPDIYISGFPASITDISYRNGNSTNTVTKFEYNNSLLPVRKTTYVNGDKRVKEETFGYDALKNLTTQSYRSYNSEWLSEEYGYDGRVMNSKTDIYGHKETYTYKLPGLVERITDYKGYSTTCKYDPIYRKIETSHPDSLVENFYTSWVNSPSGALYMTKNIATGRPESRTYYNALGQEIRVGEKRFDGSWLYTDKVYDIKGRLARESLPFKTSPANWTNYSYDDFDRVTNINYAWGAADTYSYAPNTTTVTSSGITTVRKYDPLGNLISVQDPGGTISYNYRPDGQPSSIETTGGIATTFEYDEYYRQISINDPSAGIKRFSYDQAGNINVQTDARGIEITSTYDKYNRVTRSQYGTRHTVDYTYNEDGKPLSIVAGNGKRADYTYDGLSRLVTEQEKANSTHLLKKTFQYGKGSIIDNIQYALRNSQICTENHKYTNGHLTRITLNDNIPVWDIYMENSMGLPSRINMGPLAGEYSYDIQGNTTSRFVFSSENDIQMLSYGYSPVTGNMLWRKDSMHNMPREEFGYDNLNRLTSYGGNTVQYLSNGNITGISHIGSFSYGSTKPYAITGADPAGNTVPLRNQTVKYNSLNMPDSIIENIYYCNFLYDAFGKRSEMVIDRKLRDRAYQLIRYYFSDCFEEEFLTKGYAYNSSRLYVGGDYYSAPAVYILKNSKWSLHYIIRDNLGSITHITDSQGNVLQELSYDPWGNLRDPETHALYAPDTEPELMIGRGFTGHEHLQQFRLINMNARLYDPALGRFLSPDPYVQMPDFTQNLNRYSYCFNNPLIYKDENGEWVHIAVGALVGGALNVIIDFSSGNLNSPKDLLVSFGMGAVGGALSAISPYAGAAFMGVGGSIVKQGLNKGWDNIDFGEVAMNGLTSVATVGIVQYMTPVIAPAMSNLMSGISNSYVRNSLSEGLAYGASGFVSGFAAGYIETGDPVEALKSGGMSAAYGGALGIARGSAIAYKDNKALKDLRNGSTSVSQNHHIISPKNKKYIDDFKLITDKYGLDLGNDWNKIKVSTEYHKGRHPDTYHKEMLKVLKDVDNLSKGRKSHFNYYFNLKIRQQIIKDPKIIKRK